MEKRKIEVFHDAGIAIVPLGGSLPDAPRVAIIDAADAEMIGQYNWYPKTRHGGRPDYYAVTSMRNDAGETIHMRMHRLLCPVPEDMMVDHINRNPLDNRRCNLRPATAQINALNQSPRSSNKRNGSSKYRGVYRDPHSRRRAVWVARISVKGRQLYLGGYHTEEEAARAYDRAVLEHFGPSAYQNLPDEKEDAA